MTVKTRHILGWSAVLLLMAVFAMIGLTLEKRAGVLDPEGVLISSRAMLAAWKTPKVLNEIELVSPPLPCYLGVIPAYLRLPHPAIWITALGGALGLLGGATLCGKRLRMAGGWARGYYWFVLGMVMLLPSFLAEVSLGRPGILWMAPALAALALLGRFGLDMQMIATARETGRLSAWIESDRYQQQRLRLLWGAALFLALAAFSSSSVLFLLPPLLLLAPFLLSPAERADRAKVTTLLLVVFLPVVASHLILAYLSWVFTRDGLFFIRNNFARQLLGQPVVSHIFATWRPDLIAGAVGDLLRGTALFGPVLLALLWRLRCLPVAFLLLAPFAAGLWSGAIGRPFPSGAYFTLAPLLSAIAFAFLLAYRNPGRLERALFVLAFAGMSAAAWPLALAGKMPGGAEAWSRLASESRTIDFEHERQILRALPPGLERDEILFDDAAGYALPVLLNDAEPFFVRTDPRYYSVLARPENYVEYALVQVLDPGDVVIDRVERHWLNLPAIGQPPFTRVATAGRWELWRRIHPPRPALAHPDVP